MQNRRLFPLVCGLLAAVCLALHGCRIAIQVPQGGNVKSTDGAFVCKAGETCVIDVVDFFFDETFVAEAESGYYFQNWLKLDGYLCGGETGPCRLATTDHAGSPALQSVLESDQKFFLKPRFVRVLDCPEPELVISPSSG
jgi:hypothetical protein